MERGEGGHTWTTPNPAFEIRLAGSFAPENMTGKVELVDRVQACGSRSRNEGAEQTSVRDPIS